MEQNRVEVVIDGQIITLISNEKEEYMQRIGLYIDRKLSEMKNSKSQKPVGDYIISLLVSLNIADDYFKALAQKHEMEDKLNAYIQEIGRMQEENTLLSDKLHEMQAQMQRLRDQYGKDMALNQEDSQLSAEKINQLQTQLTQAQAEHIKEVSQLQSELRTVQNDLEEYISTFDDTGQKVLNFNPVGAAR